MGDPGRWHMKPVPLCPKARAEPDPCDCGYVGPWLTRNWQELQRCERVYAIVSEHHPGQVIRPCDECKAGGDGHMVYAGWEERCPVCGDEEQFRWDGTLVEQRRNHAYSGARDHTQDDIWAVLGMDDDTDT